MQQFLEGLRTYNFEKAVKLAIADNIVGGWEVWFQVELAMHLCATLVPPTQIIREMAYPDHAARCDFYVEYGGGRDPTYIELKCQIPQRPDPIGDALSRFESDIIKQRAYTSKVAGFCLLATCGQWTENHLARLGSIVNDYKPAGAGALIIMSDGQIYIGSNIEAVWPALQEGCFSVIGISP
jgi:hypothetical protein